MEVARIEGYVLANSTVVILGQLLREVPSCDLPSLFWLLSFPCRFKQLKIPVKRLIDGERGWGQNERTIGLRFVSLMRTVIRTFLLPELRVHSSSLAFSNQCGKVFSLSGVLKPHDCGKFWCQFMSSWLNSCWFNSFILVRYCRYGLC